MVNPVNPTKKGKKDTSQYSDVFNFSNVYYLAPARLRLLNEAYDRLQYSKKKCIGGRIPNRHIRDSIVIDSLDYIEQFLHLPPEIWEYSDVKWAMLAEYRDTLAHYSSNPDLEDRFIYATAFKDIEELHTQLRFYDMNYISQNNLTGYKTNWKRDSNVSNEINRWRPEKNADNEGRFKKNVIIARNLKHS